MAVRCKMRKITTEYKVIVFSRKITKIKLQRPVKQFKEARPGERSEAYDVNILESHFFYKGSVDIRSDHVRMEVPRKDQYEFFSASDCPKMIMEYCDPHPEPHCAT